MAKTIRSALLAALIASTPALALAQSDMQTGPAPTADSAASQVGRNPPSATSPSGGRVEPSDRLWNNPRTVSEQPGTQPPASTSSGGMHRHGGAEAGRSSRGGNKTPSPADSSEQ
ncbi:hypothetical protein ACOZ4Y_03325 [Komagataeibacter rhaeticus]|uniref:Uncharacterized protein n=1 Tax=Komagataeibacter rhaeticus TaxID=215221 RepID=A0A181C9L0_9PROT|nr:hypothetical protein [Komagataeibacter rhaeticus]MBL7240656.1 hypothetical protein [Komagataeibacter rhaeticus]QIP35089.1 hypothetical protein GWK63_06020 [Komagataeibacter rhaeticus]QOC47644.1 hypothetical protein ICJ78_06090 [Komagataeibacter rhaeticus]WPP23006.1 hypothetical protein SCD25_05850 [Komagataeibacter rhaeticus]SAY48245.1 hypothetical protein KRIGEM_01191 [Komagataeibacter rhaeticus]